MALKEKMIHILKHNVAIQTCYRYSASALFRVIGLFVKTDDKLILMNGHGYKYNDSPRAIYRRMYELGLTKKYDVVWALNDPEQYDIPGARKIKMDTLNYFITALKAKYWISCVNIERALKFKKKNTVYLNTWHGGAINLCGNAVNGRNDFHWEHIDYFCSCGRYDDKFFKRDFNLREKAILKCGYPRNDELYNTTENEVAQLKNKFGLPEDKKIILYAPTWRETTDGGKSYQLAPPIDWKKWKNELGDNFIILLRTHPYTTKLMNVKFNDFVRDFTNYPEVNDLLKVSDILISDYSSIILDYSILCKPILCFGYDYEYYKKERGFYYELETEMPSGVLKTEKDVIQKLKDMDYDMECQLTKKFRDCHMEYGGDATTQCIKAVLSISAKECEVIC